MAKLFERRLTPKDYASRDICDDGWAFLAAMLVTAFLFLSYGASPLQAYFALFHEPLRNAASVSVIRWCGLRRWR